MSLIPFLTPCSVSNIAPPTTGVRTRERLPQSRNRSYPCVVRSVARCSASPPMVGA